MAELPLLATRTTWSARTEGTLGHSATAERTSVVRGVLRGVGVARTGLTRRGVGLGVALGMGLGVGTSVGTSVALAVGPGAGRATGRRSSPVEQEASNTPATTAVATDRALTWPYASPRGTRSWR